MIEFDNLADALKYKLNNDKANQFSTLIKYYKKYLLIHHNNTDVQNLTHFITSRRNNYYE